MEHCSPQTRRRLGSANYRTGKELDKELSVLEKERRTKLRELEQATNYFREHSLNARSRSPSPRAKSPQSPLKDRPDFYEGSPPKQSPRFPITATMPPRISSAASNRDNGFRIHQNGNRDRSLSPSSHGSSESSPRISQRPLSPSPRGSGSPMSPRSPRSPCKVSPKSTASPEAPRRLLSKRQTTRPTSAKTTNVSMTTLTPVDLSQRNRTVMMRSPSMGDDSMCTGLPQIVIDEPLSENPTQTPTQDSDGQSKNDVMQLGDNSDIIDRASKTSLALPARRTRSSSVPSIKETVYLQSVAHSQSSFSTDTNTIDIPVPIRGRSNSVCVPYHAHLQNSPRRESLINKYTARRGSFRRTSKTLKELIADAERNIGNLALFERLFGATHHKREEIPPEVWEKLKECRYLRMPSHDEDVRGNNIDIDEIFGHNK